MNRHPFIVWAGFAWLAIAQVWCAPRDVVIADLPDTENAGERPEHREPCASERDCEADEFCEKDACGAALGKCKHRATLCSSDPEPVCGCNGITYWNDCLRRASGIEAMILGECTNAASCGDDMPCPDTAASCAFLAPEPIACARTTTGVCWVLPTTCPTATPNGGAWEKCGTPGTCGDLCTAIRAESPYNRLREPTCPSPKRP